MTDSRSDVGTLEMPRLVAWLRPLVDRVASIRASVHAKLLVGFLIGAVLLVAMGGLSVAVLIHMAQRDQEVNAAEQRLDRFRQMLYLVTAQSHYRAMALLTQDSTYNDEITAAKASFNDLATAVQDAGVPEQDRGLFARVVEANQRYTVSSAHVLALYQQGDIAGATQAHLSEEHPISHQIEDPTNLMIQDAIQQMDASQATLESDQRLMVGVVVGFSVLSLLTALLLGFVLSWSFMLPLGSLGRALARLARGNFDTHVDVPNQDEFGELARNLNATGAELAQLYGQLEQLNAQLRGTNTELLAQLQSQVTELARSRGLITEAEERLRREISEVLHSRVQNRLLMVWFRLEECQDLLARDPEAAQRMLGEIRDQIDQIREQDVRELSHRLHPSIIRAGLLPALEALVEDMPRPAVTILDDPSVTAVDHPSQNGIPEDVRLTAYRVVEEALGNVARHAAATHAEVKLAVVDNDLEVDVRDDGRGFDEQTLQPGLGLGSISAHVGRVGGRWRITSTVGQGTCLSVRLPLPSSASTHDPRVAISSPV